MKITLDLLFTILEITTELRIHLKLINSNYLNNNFCNNSVPNKGRVKQKVLKSAWGALFVTPSPLVCFFPHTFWMPTKKLLWVLNTFKAHCNPPLLYLYMKIWRNVQLKYHLSLIFFSKNHNRIVDHHLPFTDPNPSAPPVYFFFTFLYIICTAVSTLLVTLNCSWCSHSWPAGAHRRQQPVIGFHCFEMWSLMT